MKIKSVLVAILLLWATGLVRAQITVQVQKADLAIPFGSASGKAVRRSHQSVVKQAAGPHSPANAAGDYVQSCWVNEVA